jgi:hypothetical protein
LAEALDSDQPTSSKSRRLRAPATTVIVEPRPKRPGAFFVGERQNPGQLALLGTSRIDWIIDRSISAASERSSSLFRASVSFATFRC